MPTDPCPVCKAGFDRLVHEHRAAPSVRRAQIPAERQADCNHQQLDRPLLPATEYQCPDCLAAFVVAPVEAAAPVLLSEYQKRIEAADRWIVEAASALEAATAISERMWRTHVVEGLNLGNHDRLVRESVAVRAALGSTKPPRSES